MFKMFFLLFKGKAEVSLYFLLCAFTGLRLQMDDTKEMSDSGITQVMRHEGPCSVKLLTTYVRHRIKP